MKWCLQSNQQGQRFIDSYLHPECTFIRFTDPPESVTVASQADQVLIVEAIADCLNTLREQYPLTAIEDALDGMYVTVDRAQGRFTGYRNCEEGRKSLVSDRWDDIYKMNMVKRR